MQSSIPLPDEQVSVVTACTPTIESQAPTDPQDTENNSNSALEALALRLLISRYMESDPADGQLLPGQLPADIDLPLPEDTTLIGSMVNPPQEVRIVLDSNQSAEEVIAFFEETLPSSGWTIALEPEQGGFVGDPMSWKSYASLENIWRIAGARSPGGSTGEGIADADDFLKCLCKDNWLLSFTELASLNVYKPQSPHREWASMSKSICHPLSAGV